MSYFRTIKKFLQILSKEQKIQVIWILILMIGGGVLEMFSVSLVLPFMEAVSNSQEVFDKWYGKLICFFFKIKDPRHFLIIMALLLALLYLLKNVYLMFQYDRQYKFTYSGMLGIQGRLLKSYMERPYSFYLNAESSEIIRVICEDTRNSFTLLMSILSMTSEAIVSGMISITIFVITPVITLCMSFVLLLLVVIINFVIKPVLKRASVQYQKSYAGMFKWVSQSIEGIKELKISGRENYFQKKFNTHGNEYINALRKFQILNVTPRFIIEACSMSSMFIVVAVLIFVGNDLNSLIPILTAVAVSAIRILPSVNRISAGLGSIAFYEPMLDKLIVNLSDTVFYENLYNENMTVSDDSKNITFKESIRFEGVTFSYPNSDVEVLRRSNMEIKKGDSVGVIGTSGSGKTTSIDILLGLLAPGLGRVCVDNQDILSNVRSWNNQVGYIPQMIFMLDASILENICFGLEGDDINEKKVWNALKEASLDEFVGNLPQGLNTQIGERGVRLSGGQRQRIGIARALYNNPSVLVFDEATSALDNETEEAIMESIHKLHGQKTMIIIAHRLSTIESCDHIYRVERGKIIKER